MKVCLESELVSKRFNKFTPEVLAKLTNFFMAQRALSVELLVAKPLGMCKITTSIDQKGISTRFSGEGFEEMY